MLVTSAQTIQVSRVQHTTSAVAAAVLPSLRVEAVSSSVIGRALSVAVAAGLGAGVAVSADSLLRNVAVGVATSQAQPGQWHDRQAVRLGLRGRAGSVGQEGNGSGSSEKHLDWVLCDFFFLVRVLRRISNARKKWLPSS